MLSDRTIPTIAPWNSKKIGKELAHVVVAAQIVPPVGDDQKPDAKDQEGEEEPKPVQHQGDVQAKRRHPFKPGRHNLARQEWRAGSSKGRRRQRKRP